MPRFDLTAATSALLLIDVQERFLAAIPTIAADQSVGRNCRILLEVANLLTVPTLISEQYPKGLGTTLPHLIATAPAVLRLEKTHFSCCDDIAVQAAIDHLGRPHLVLCGIETHVCVLATAADLITRGYHVTIASDAVASRNEASRDTALSALRALGTLVLPTESIVLRWQRQAGVGAFKTIAQLIR